MIQESDNLKKKKILETKDFQLMRNIDEYHSNIEKFFQQKKDFNQDKELLDNLKINLKEKEKFINEYRQNHKQEKE